MTTPAERPTFTGLVLMAARDPWILLTGLLGGGLAWAVGVPVLFAVAVAVVMVATAATVGVLTGKSDSRPSGAFEPRLRPGTEQLELVRTLDSYIDDLAALRGSPLVSEVSSPAIEALVAAQGSREGAVRAAASIDLLDEALARSTKVRDRWGGQQAEIGSSVQRMHLRRTEVISRLREAVGEVAEVYTKILELSATIGSAALGDSASAVDEVSASLDSLRGAFAELEAAAPSPDDPLTR